MFDHITLNVSNFSRSKTFYEQALAPLGYKVVASEDGIYCGFGIERAHFWISQGDNENPACHGVHIAFSASSRIAVNTFHALALTTGGTDNGKPGVRLEYGENYYAAFVRDPDGNNIEVVTFGE